jgi:Protein kinase domain/Caspase domain
MAIEALSPSPQTTLIVMLGAYEWPRSPDFQTSKAFKNSASAISDYFLDPSAFGLPRKNLLDLFNSDLSPDAIDTTMSQFLDERISEMRKSGNIARDLIVYFIGHGGFTRGDLDYYLAIRRTRADNPITSSILIGSLAYTIKEKARYLRRFIILDCCFAASASRFFQAVEPTQVSIKQAIDAFKVQDTSTGFPTRGTSLLCSSRHNAPSFISRDNKHTMFSKALLHALRTGNPYLGMGLSLRAVAQLTEDFLQGIYSDQGAPRPEVHSPDQSEGDVADIPFFPNLTILIKEQKAERKLYIDRQNEKSQSETSVLEYTPLPPGTILDRRFRIVRELGRGGMSTVYLVVRVEKPSKFWAIKQLLPVDRSNALSEISIKLFDNEIDILSELKHPYIPSLIRSFEEGGSYFYLMEYAPGFTLEQILEKAQGPLDEMKVIYWMMQVCEVLSYIHSFSPPIIMRDVKPGNIIVTPDNSVRVIDFSIARRFDPNKQTNTMNLGTIVYASPDHLGSINTRQPLNTRQSLLEQGPRIPIQTDARSDIYSVGATMYHLLTNNEPEPMSTPDPGSILAKNSSLHTMQIENRVICPTEQVIIKAMQLDRYQRFQNAAAMRVALDYCLSK